MEQQPRPLEDDHVVKKLCERFPTVPNERQTLLPGRVFMCLKNEKGPNETTEVVRDIKCPHSEHRDSSTH